MIECAQFFGGINVYCVRLAQEAEGAARVLNFRGSKVFWLVSGDKDIANAILQLDKESDRAAAIIAASIVEIRLEEAIKTRLRKDEAATKKMFDPNRPLFDLGPKIDLAYLLSMLSAAAYADLKNFCTIRNHFAHRLDITDFSTSAIKDRCFNFKLVDHHVGTITKEELEKIINDPGVAALEDAKKVMAMPPEKRGIMWRSTGADEALKNPKRRYILTAQLLSYSFGSTAWATRSDELI